MKIKFFVLLFLGIYLISSVGALGVTPARTTIDFEPGMERTIEFEVLNSEGKDMDLALSVQGELAKYITTSPKRVSVSASEKSKKFNYRISLPENLEPGINVGEVLIMEVPEEVEAGGSQVSATLAVVIQLHVYVPYPGKYANADMIVNNANQGETVTFIFPVVSAGEFDLTSVRANVDIYNKLSEKVDSFNTESIEVPSGKKKDIVYHWKADVPIGDYLAVGTVIYDEGTVNLERRFSVGSRELELQSIDVSDFSLGDIAKLEMLVENKWSEPISDAHIETVIRKENGDLVSRFKSASYDVAALSKEVFVSYWDTAGVRVGTYETEVSINYADQSSKKSLQFQVEENELIVIGLGYVISSGGGEESDSLVRILVVVIVVLVAINLLWFFLIRKRLKK